MFIERGGTPNALNSQDQTCLHAACFGLGSMGGSARSSTTGTPAGASPAGGGGGGGGGGLSSLVSHLMVSGGLQTKPKPGVPAEQLRAARLFCLEVLLSWQGIEIDGQVCACGCAGGVVVGEG